MNSVNPKGLDMILRHLAEGLPVTPTMMVVLKQLAAINRKNFLQEAGISYEIGYVDEGEVNPGELEILDDTGFLISQSPKPQAQLPKPKPDIEPIYPEDKE